MFYINMARKAVPWSYNLETPPRQYFDGENLSPEDELHKVLFQKEQVEITPWEKRQAIDKFTSYLD